MFGEITLIVKTRDQETLDLLNHLPVKSKPVLLPQEHKRDKVCYDVRELAMRNSADVNFLKDFRDLQVFTLDVFKSGEIIPDFNSDLLRFVKHCAMNAGSELKIRYELERGDFLYEEIVWTFNYLNSNTGIIEQLYVHDHNNVKFGQVTKFRNGEVIFEGLKPIK